MTTGTPHATGNAAPLTPEQVQLLNELRLRASMLALQIRETGSFSSTDPTAIRLDRTVRRAHIELEAW